MRYVTGIFLNVVFLALGAGVVQYAHSLEHLHEHAALHDHARFPEPADKDHPANCFLHAVLQAPMLSAGWVPLLVCLGLLIAFLTLWAERPAAVRLLTRIDCRGPPTLA